MKLTLLILLIITSQLVSKELEKVSLQLYSKYQFESAGFIAAKEKGFYEDLGLDVDLKEYVLGIDIENSVISGQSNYGIYNSNIFDSFIKGKPIKLIASIFKRSQKESLMDYSLNGELFTSEKEADNNFERTKNFKKASIKGWIYALEHKEEIIDIIKEKYNNKSSKDLLIKESKEVQRLIRPYIYKIGSINKVFFENKLKLLKEKSIISNKVDIEKFIFNSKVVVNFTKTELEYLKDKEIVNVCTNPNWSPIEFTKNNKAQGISIDNLMIIEKYTNLKFNFIETSSWTQSQEFLKSKICDILPSVIKTKARKLYANFTKPYLIYDLVIITKKDKPLAKNIHSLINKKMSRKEGSGLIAELKKSYPNIKINQTKTYLKSFEEVANGRVYFTVAIRPVFSYYKNKHNLDNLHISGYTKKKYKLSIAVRKDDTVLLGILNKSLDKISKTTQIMIFKKWVNRENETKFNYSLFSKIMLVLFVVFLFILYRQRQLKKYNHTLEKMNQKLKLKKIELLNHSIKNKQLNETLEKRVSDEVEKNRERDKHMIHQSKLAQMGEMISMIAHQWRQPLSAISSTSGALNIKAKLDKADNDLIIEYTNKILDYSQHLSSTIDDFRDFFKPNKEKREVTYTKLIDSVLSIIGTSIKNKNITLIKELNCESSFFTYHNEVKQVILNIIKNAEDILLENKIRNPIIKILTREDAGDYILEIIDNGGGIKEDIIEKIFEPYFSTKSKKNGTGLGLYMSKVIIEDHCQGSLSVSNIINNPVDESKYFLIKGIEHTSTVFKIVLKG